MTELLLPDVERLDLRPFARLRKISCPEPRCRFVFWTDEDDPAVIHAAVLGHLRADHDTELNDR